MSEKRTSGVWKVISVCLLSVVLGYGSNVLAESLDLRERVTKLETRFELVIDRMNDVIEQMKDLNKRLLDRKDR